jgi:hypothetical protein
MPTYRRILNRTQRWRTLAWTWAPTRRCHSVARAIPTVCSSQGTATRNRVRASIASTIATAGSRVVRTAPPLRKKSVWRASATATAASARYASRTRAFFRAPEMRHALQAPLCATATRTVSCAPNASNPKIAPSPVQASFVTRTWAHALKSVQSLPPMRAATSSTRAMPPRRARPTRPPAATRQMAANDVTR